MVLSANEWNSVKYELEHDLDNHKPLVRALYVYLSYFDFMKFISGDSLSYKEYDLEVEKICGRLYTASGHSVTDIQTICYDVFVEMFDKNILPPYADFYELARLLWIFMVKTSLRSNPFDDIDQAVLQNSKKCFVCNQDARQMCSVCKHGLYCDVPCQQKDWAKHKQICAHPNALKTSVKLILPRF